MNNTFEPLLKKNINKEEKQLLLLLNDLPNIKEAKLLMNLPAKDIYNILINNYNNDVLQFQTASQSQAREFELQQKKSEQKVINKAKYQVRKLALAQAKADAEAQAKSEAQAILDAKIEAGRIARLQSIQKKQAKKEEDKIIRNQLKENTKLEKEQQQQKKFELNNLDYNLNTDIQKLVDGLTDKININLLYIFNNTSLTFKDVIIEILKIVKSRLYGTNILLEVGNVSYCLNEITINKLEKFILDDVENIHEEYSMSDGQVIGELKNASNISISIMEKSHKNNKANGAHFPYTHLLEKIDLTRFGIFKDIRCENETCLLQALLNGGLSKSIVEELKIFVKNRRIPKSDFDKICHLGKFGINLKNIDDVSNRNNGRNMYGKEYDIVFNIGLIEEHYFIIEETEYTSFSIENYDEVNNEKDFNFIFAKRGNTYRKDRTRTINSFELIKLLVKNKDKYLKKITCDDNAILATQFYDKIINDDIIDLEYNEEECVRANFDTDDIKSDKKKKDKLPKINVFADFETDPNEEHIPIALCYEYILNDEVVKHNFWGIDCGCQGLNKLYKQFKNIYDVVLIFHNAKYDYRFIIQYGFKIKELTNGGLFISSSFIFKGLNVMIKDSYKLITMGLSHFTKTFNLGEVVKEVIPYDFYNQSRVNTTYELINEALKYLKNDKEKEQFIKNVNDWGLVVNEKYFLHKQYLIKYCQIDCEILRKGYNKFKDWINEYFKIDIDEVLTISSLAFRIFKEAGCYDGTYSLGGKVQNFISKCVVGGRTMCKNNEKNIVVGSNYDNYEKGFDEFLNDLDAVSLYPSAYIRMNGFLKGTPKVITNKSYNDLKNKDGYFVKILITKVSIVRDFPLMSFINDKKVRIFTNDMIGKEIYVDKISLEDLINFQKIEFEILKGYYYDDGHNDKAIEVMKYIFTKRLDLKKQKNNAELVFKLIMNSAYGKNIQKPHDEKIYIFDNESEYKTYLSRNYNWIKEVIIFGEDDNLKYKVKSIDDISNQFNNCHIGCEILSMSKRIMNEVMTLAEDNNIEIYYQDTDSTHLKNKDIKKLEVLFFEKYNRVLIGKNMGQFHSDFSIGKIDKDVYARRSIFLAKKVYIDELICRVKNEDGSFTEVVDYHIRMKGITDGSINYTYKLLGYNNPFELYEELYKGAKIDFDLLEGNSKKKFKFNKDYTINTIKNTEFNKGFTRSIHFN